MGVGECWILRFAQGAEVHATNECFSECRFAEYAWILRVYAEGPALGQTDRWWRSCRDIGRLRRRRVSEFAVIEAPSLRLCRYVTESYLQTDEGKEEAQRAKKEGSKFYLQAKEVVLRPGVAGGLVGAGT